MIHSDRSGGLKSSLLGGLAALALFVGLAVVMRPERTAPVVGPVTPGPTQTNAERERVLELRRILDGMGPLSLQINTDPGRLTGDLNGWFQEFGPKADATPMAKDQDLIAQLLQGETLRRAGLKSFSIEDTHYIRECLMARRAIEQLAADLTSDQARVLKVFEYVTREVNLIGTNPDSALPLSPYESLLYSLGTRDDRIWVLAALLRQLELDTVVITPNGGNAPVLVGVISPREGIFLLDPRMGLPIPGSDDNLSAPSPTSIATLQQVLADDAPLRSLYGDAAFSGESLKNATVEIVGTASSWAPRFAELQFLLPPGLDVVLHDGLGPSDARPQGQYQRVVDAGASGLWTADNVKVWRYPEQVLEAIAAARGEANPQLAQLWTTFHDGPVDYRPDANGNLVKIAADKSLQLVRTEQIVRELRQALQDYTPIRRLAFHWKDEAINQQAGKYAMLFSGICQFEVISKQSAISTFDQFRRDEIDQSLIRFAEEWKARALAAEGEFAKAADTLAAAKPWFTPETDKYLIARWRAIAAKPQE